MAALLPTGSLAEIVDDHINWLIEWNRLAFLDLGIRSEQAKSLIVPSSLEHWQKASLDQTLSQDQPAVERLVAQFDQLHTLARLVLIKTPDRQPVAGKDYEGVILKYQEMMMGLRRLERAFAAAASGLDLLTGLRSRLGLQEDLAREHSRFLRTGKSFCVAMMDIDFFKKVNDTFGHDAGDRVLATVADHISHGLRSFDDAYRVGGEEFLLCLKEADIGMGHMVLERLRKGLEKKPIILADGQAINVTASFGLIVSDKELASIDMAQHADQALYRAKHEGRNRIVIVDKTIVE